jgi:heat shock protein HslJ
MTRIRLSFAGVALATGVLLGCATPPTAPAAWPLEGTYWRLVALRGQPVTAAPRGRDAHMLLDAAERRVAGNSGCNRMTGSYTLDGSALRFGQMVGTRMACASGMDIEAGFLSALGSVSRWQLTGDLLQLLDGGGAVLAELASGSERCACDFGKTLLVHYDNADPQRAEAWLSHDGRSWRLRAVPAASGARYAVNAGRSAGRALEWSTKGDEGLLREGPAGSASDGWEAVARCRRG